MFPRAPLFIHPLEIAYWLDDNELTHASERRQRNFTLVRHVLDVWGNRAFLSDEKDKLVLCEMTLE